MSASVQPAKDRRGRVYVPAIGPGLRPLLWVLLIGFALMGANGTYLASVTALTWWTATTQQTFFYMLMVIVHLALGFAIILPFLAFGSAHLVTSWKRPNKSAVRFGLALLACSCVILISGLILVRLDGFEVRDPRVRYVGYWLHVAAPLVAIGLYVKHRLAGPMIRWHWARRIGTITVLFIGVMGLLHSQDPRSFGVKGPSEGKKYFLPSSAITANGKFIPAETLMMDDYCLKCHQDTYNGWFHSSHHMSSFNNKAYLMSVRETRQVSLKRDGNTRAARWCAGCHDPVPFFSGEFDDPNYDDVSTRSSQAGITCTVCHSINNVNSTRGNADYTIEEPQHYPFATSNNPVLQWINLTLVKAKPDMHKKTFLKPVIKDSKFCSTCHKVSIPYALNHYKDFLRGQNHYDTFLLSGVSGHGARSFYYPPKAKSECSQCHMPFQTATNDFGAKSFDDKPGLDVHDHMFPAANTGLATMIGSDRAKDVHETYLKDKKVRIDIFGLRDGGSIDSPLVAPLRPESPLLKKGKPYLVEVVVRTLGLGHPFSQGTVDSNEIWVELIAKAGDQVIGRSGGIGENGAVDPYSHFINVYMLDRTGKRIDRRNPQDIFVPLYNKQIPPGAGQIVHFGLDVPESVKGPITLEAKVNYRKFDRTYMDFIFGPGKGPNLPVVEMASDALTLGIEGSVAVKNEPSPIKPDWQRWNDYGIGLFLEGSDKGGSKGELRQAEEVFKKVAALGPADGWVNLARVYQREGRIPDALGALEKAAAHKEPAAPWTINWLTGQINDRNGHLDEAIANYESVLNTKIPDRGFDFSLDYEVINLLANSLYNRARVEALDSAERIEFLQKARATYLRTLAIDSESVAAHYGLGLIYGELARGAKPPNPADAPMEIHVNNYSHDLSFVASPRTSGKDQLYFVEHMLPEELQVIMTHPEDYSRLDSLYETIEKLDPLYASAPDPQFRAALARLLETVHKGLHKLLKPDELAEGRAVANARKDNPAADMNAQSIVIHPMHRAGAPGIDTPKKTAAGVIPSSESAPLTKGGE